MRQVALQGRRFMDSLQQKYMSHHTDLSIRSDCKGVVSFSVSRSGCCVMRPISGENPEGILRSAIGKTVYAGHVRAGPGQGRANSAHAHRGVSGLGFRRLLRPARQAGAVPVGHAVSDQPISRIWRRIGSGTERQSRQPLDSSTPAARPSCALKMGFLLAKTDPDTRLSKVNRGEGFA